MKFTEIPRRLQPLLAPPDPIVIHHLIKYALTNQSPQLLIKVSVMCSADAPEGKRTACYDIEMEIVSAV